MSKETVLLSFLYALPSSFSFSPFLPPFLFLFLFLLHSPHPSSLPLFDLEGEVVKFEERNIFCFRIHMLFTTQPVNLGGNFR